MRVITCKQVRFLRKSLWKLLYTSEYFHTALFYFNVIEKVLIILFWILFKILCYNRSFHNFHANIMVITLGYFSSFSIAAHASHSLKKNSKIVFQTIVSLSIPTMFFLFDSKINILSCIFDSFSINKVFIFPLMDFLI